MADRRKNSNPTNPLKKQKPEMSKKGKKEYGKKLEMQKSYVGQQMGN